MPRPKSAFPLIGNNLPRYCKQLSEIPPCEFWIHESKVAEYLKLPRGPDHGQSEVLTKILGCLEKGHGGNKKKNTYVATGSDKVDLSAEKNRFGVNYQQKGRVERFARGYHNKGDFVKRRPRWFKFGNVCEIEVGQQLAIAKELVGDVPVEGSSDDPAVLPMGIIKRRKTSYTKFYNGENGSATYRNWDFPHIAYRYKDLCKGVTD